MATKDISDKQVCLAYAEAKKQHEYPYIILQRITGQPEKVCLGAMERACKRNYIEYGVSLRTGWLTEKGLSLLNE